jgi:hypothetical protein
MATMSGSSGDAVLASTFRAVAGRVIGLRRRVGVHLDQVELWLRAQDVARDPEAQRWAEDMKAKVASGELQRSLATQPADPAGTS